MTETSCGQDMEKTSRILDWIIKRCESRVEALESPIGMLPKHEDINLEGLKTALKKNCSLFLHIDKNLWLEETKNIEEFYSKFGERLPEALNVELNILKNNLM